MLSATVGSLADTVVDDVAVDAPEVSLDQVEELGIATGSFEWAGVLGCIAYPPATFFWSGDTDESDPTAPPSVELAPEDSVDPGVVPLIITDPVVTVEPGGMDDANLVPPSIEPLDIRVEFVSSDPGWAAYYYIVGVDGSVYVMVCASYDEPAIADFVSGDSEARAYATVEDTGDGWFIWNFPADLAPPVPEAGVFALTGGVDPIFDTFGNPDPADVLPTSVDSTSIDEAESTDSEVAIEVRAFSTVGGTQSPGTVLPVNDASYNWMAAFAASIPGAGGDSPQPVTGRRRSR